jgi:hypothetical protein
VHCAVLLERTQPLWKLDRKESTRLSLKYRRGKGEILIVSHAGKGWWDSTSDAKGDVFDLVQWLEPGLTFGQGCRIPKIAAFALLNRPQYRMQKYEIFIFPFISSFAPWRFTLRGASTP